MVIVMKKVKKALLSILAIAFVFNVCFSYANALTKASEYIRSAQVEIFSGSGRGELDIEFSVRAATNTTKLGVSRIEIYESNGDYVTAVRGSVANGLLSDEGGRYYSNTYTFEEGNPGTSYYAVVTIYAGDEYGSDTQEIETSIARAAY